MVAAASHSDAKERVRIGFFLPGLDGGGAERMTLNLMPAMYALGYAPFLIVGSRRGVLWRSVPPGTDVHCLETESWIAGLVRLRKALRERRPAVLISSMGRCNILAVWARALGGVRTKIVMREHVVMSRLAVLSGGRVAWVPFFYRLFGRWADARMAVSDEVADDMAQMTRTPRQAIRVIHNPVLTADLAEQLARPVEHPFFAARGVPVFLGVGRLTAQKDFATLIAAFAQFRGERDGRLILLGDGELRAALVAQCERLGVAPDVAFLGFQENRLAYMKRAAALVLPSLMEGFSNVLVEALAAGTQVVSTDCVSGPRFILEGGRHGTLVPVGDAAAMARAMRDAIDHPRPADAGRRRAAQFTAERAARAYAEMIEDLRRA